MPNEQDPQQQQQQAAQAAEAARKEQEKKDREAVNKGLMDQKTMKQLSSTGEEARKRRGK